jgi:hypothetical protein
MEDVKIKLSALWAALMLTYLLGDVLRIFSGDFTAGELGGLQISQELMLGMAALLVIPAVMIFLSVTLKHSVNRWINIVFAIFFFGFNLIGLPTYASAYDQFLIIVGLIFNILTVWYAWSWPKQEDYRVH